MASTEEYSNEFSWFEEEYNELQYPVKPSYTRYSIFKEGKVYASNLTLQELNEQKLKIEPNIELKKFGFTVEETFDENGFQNALNRYHRSKAGLVERLKNSLFEKYKLRSTPRSEFIWEHSWESFDETDVDLVVKTFETWVKILFLPNE